MLRSRCSITSSQEENYPGFGKVLQTQQVVTSTKCLRFQPLTTDGCNYYLEGSKARVHVGKAIPPVTHQFVILEMPPSPSVHHIPSFPAFTSRARLARLSSKDTAALFNLSPFRVNQAEYNCKAQVKITTFRHSSKIQNLRIT